MLREIKFRGKRIDNGEWVYGYLLSDCAIGQWARCKYEVIPETVGQFTGLKDNKRTKEFPNGQDIYEGDVMKTKRFRESINMITETVSFEDGCFVTFTDFDITVPLSYHELLDIEIIGNIHEQSKEVSNA